MEHLSISETCTTDMFLALGLQVHWGGSALASLLGLGLCVLFFL